ncbi:glycosyltransferase family 2 protein [Microbacterium hominis]|uniref:Glycosyltransferase family 2 protein n=1 Tax=Microbacterium hominis TaxID=162426 RepID=A0A7D4UIU7_9MICO|nr:glycosyltransferase family 2 protein [Microbacterium hominis]QKJ20288.1 glycosyltransferase family 2 protein [Microbacterium hominis]
MSEHHAGSPHPVDPLPPAADVTVVIVNFNTRDDTVACVGSVLATRGDLDVHVVVVDNGSVDGSVDALRAAHPGIHVIEAGENLGFARAVNRGAAVAEGEFVLLLNPDALMLEESLPALVSFARDNPQYRVFGGRTLRGDLTLEPSSCWGAPSLWSLTMYATMLSTVFKRSRLFDPESLGRWPRNTIREVPIITGCLLLISRDDFAELGGMDEDFFLYGEDAEFSMRAAAHGMTRLVYPPAAIIHTVGGSSAGSSKGSMVLAGKVTYLRKVWRPRRAAAGVLLLKTGVAVRAALEQVTGRRRGAWTTVWRRRRDWEQGYPHAEAALFGRPVPAPAG